VRLAMAEVTGSSRSLRETLAAFDARVAAPVQGANAGANVRAKNAVRGAATTAALLEAKPELVDWTAADVSNWCADGPLFSRCRFKESSVHRRARAELGLRQSESTAPVCRLRALDVPGAEYAAEQLRHNGIDGSCLRTIDLTDDNLRFAFGIDSVVERAGVLQGACLPAPSCRAQVGSHQNIHGARLNSPAGLGEVRPRPLHGYDPGLRPCRPKTPAASR
jgi:hypothetical protein